MTPAEEIAALKGEVARLRVALGKLSAEVSATLGLCEPELRQILGNTNVNVLTLRWNEAKAALARAEGDGNG